MKNTAVVVKHTGSHYLLSQLPEWKPFQAVIRGKMRLKGADSTNPVAVGDIVEYEVSEGGDGTCVITGILPRKNYVIRKSTNLSRQSHIIAANIDTVYLIVTIDFPETKLAFVDRFLVTCEAYRIPVKILINKTDLYTEEHAELLSAFEDIYHKAGYTTVRISAERGDNMEWLKHDMNGKIVLFSGMSGVGKSSIIKSLDPTVQLKTGEISNAHNQGKHTTTFYEMHPIASGGYIIDTPGIRGFGLVDLKDEEIAMYFPEMFALSGECRFSPCTHTHEPGCAVKQAVENGDIAYERYESYLGMLEEEGKYR